MTLSNVLANSFFDLLECSRSGRLGKEQAVHVLGAESPRSTDRDAIALEVPLELTAWMEVEPLADFCRYRNLALRGESRLS
jgi:hypothetical protein